MTNQEKVLEFLKKHENFYCDDCLSKLCNIQPRQTVFSVCSKLAKSNQIIRKKGICDYCSRNIDKNVSSFDRNRKITVELQRQDQNGDNFSAPNLLKHDALQKLDLGPFLEKFGQSLSNGSVEIYNEFSLQHELGIYLRDALPNGYKVQFERNISFFGLNKSEFVKKEMDLVIFDQDRKDKYCIELKYPLNGQYPEEMFSFVKDVKFLEQLKDAGFRGCYSLVVVADKPFFQGNNHSGIYRMFRETHCISGKVDKPTANREHISIEVKGRYPFSWKRIDQGKMYYWIAL